MESIFKSTRSFLAVLAMILLFVVVVGHFMGYKLPEGVLALVSMVLSNIMIAYFGTRTPQPPMDSTTTFTSTTVSPATPTIDSEPISKAGND